MSSAETEIPKIDSWAKPSPLDSGSCCACAGARGGGATRGRPTGAASQPPTSATGSRGRLPELDSALAAEEH
jgi:hypothetical protein